MKLSKKVKRYVRYCRDNDSIISLVGFCSYASITPYELEVLQQTTEDRRALDILKNEAKAWLIEGKANGLFKASISFDEICNP